MKKLLIIACVLMLGACATPRDEAYCATFRLTKESVEYSNCKAYFAKMEGWFNTDRLACEGIASSMFPEYMYDHPRYAETQSIDRFGNIRTSNVLIEPDYIRNQSLDYEREKIIAPCMQQKGWLSSQSWQTGRIGQNTQPAF